MKKGRHRRFEEARALKQSGDPVFDALLERDEEACPECGRLPGHDHASWCLHEETVAADDSWGDE